MLLLPNIDWSASSFQNLLYEMRNTLSVTFSIRYSQAAVSVSLAEEATSMRLIQSVFYPLSVFDNLVCMRLHNSYDT